MSPWERDWLTLYRQLIELQRIAEGISTHPDPALLDNLVSYQLTLIRGSLFGLEARIRPRIAHYAKKRSPEQP